MYSYKGTQCSRSDSSPAVNPSSSRDRSSDSTDTSQGTSEVTSHVKPNIEPPEGPPKHIKPGQGQSRNASRKRTKIIRRQKGKQECPQTTYGQVQLPEVPQESEKKDQAGGGEVWDEAGNDSKS